MPIFPSYLYKYSHQFFFIPFIFVLLYFRPIFPSYLYKSSSYLSYYILGRYSHHILFLNSENICPIIIILLYFQIPPLYFLMILFHLIFFFSHNIFPLIFAHHILLKSLSYFQNWVVTAGPRKGQRSHHISPHTPSLDRQNDNIEHRQLQTHS